MKKRKTRLIIAIVAALVLSLAACGGNAGSGQPQETSEMIEPATVKQPESSPETVPTSGSFVEESSSVAAAGNGAEDIASENSTPEESASPGPAPEESSPEEPEPDSPYAAYRGIVEEAEKEYGILSFDNMGWCYKVAGTGYLRVFDLDWDEDDELFLVHDAAEDSGYPLNLELDIYTMQGQEAKQIYAGPAYLEGVDGVRFRTMEDEDGNSYLCLSGEEMGSYRLLGLRDDEFYEEASFDYNSYDEEAEGFYVGEKLYRTGISDSLNYGSSDDQDNVDWAAKSRQLYRDMHSWMGMADPADETVLLDDMYVTVRLIGRESRRYQSKEMPGYLLEVTNHQEYTIIPNFVSDWFIAAGQAGFPVIMIDGENRDRFDTKIYGGETVTIWLSFNNRGLRDLTEETMKNIQVAMDLFTSTAGGALDKELCSYSLIFDQDGENHLVLLEEFDTPVYFGAENYSVTVDGISAYYGKKGFTGWFTNSDSYGSAALYNGRGYAGTARAPEENISKAEENVIVLDTGGTMRANRRVDYDTYGSETMHEPLHVELTAVGRYSDETMAIDIYDPETTVVSEEEPVNVARIPEEWSGRTQDYENRLFRSVVPEEWKIQQEETDDLVYALIDEPMLTKTIGMRIGVMTKEWSEDSLREELKNYRDSGYTDREALLYEGSVNGQDTWIMDIHAGMGFCTRDIYMEAPDGTRFCLTFAVEELNGVMDFTLIQDIMDQFLEHLEYK